MPRPGEPISQGTLLDFLVADGAHIRTRDPLRLIETEKVELEVAAPVGGTLRPVATTGLEYQLGALLAVIDVDIGVCRNHVSWRISLTLRGGREPVHATRGAEEPHHRRVARGA
jgi:pyruvate/2-oxoglutarate dehydrogenase complex dihydrolipoamide acyltransferase (E2) component